MKQLSNFGFSSICICLDIFAQAKSYATKTNLPPQSVATSFGILRVCLRLLLVAVY